MEDNKNNKGLVIKVGAVLVVVVLLAIWLTNLKNVWREAALKAPAVSNAEWEEFREDLDSSLTEIKEALDKRSATTTSETDNQDQSDLDELLRETAERATSTATSSGPVKTNRSCPAWINCMPMIDGPGYSPGACSIPPGCEGITEIVY